MTFDPSKPVCQRNGRPARIVSTDGKCDHPIAAWIMAQDGKEHSSVFQVNGTAYFASRDFDLINIPVKRVQWINIYAYGTAYHYPTEEEAIGCRNANMKANAKCLATVRVEFTEGEGQ